MSYCKGIIIFCLFIFSYCNALSQQKNQQEVYQLKTKASKFYISHHYYIDYTLILFSDSSFTMIQKGYQNRDNKKNGEYYKEVTKGKWVLVSDVLKLFSTDGSPMFFKRKSDKIYRVSEASSLTYKEAKKNRVPIWKRRNKQFSFEEFLIKNKLTVD